MSSEIGRTTPGPIAQTYRPVTKSWGVVFSACSNIWLLSFGARGHALAVGWLLKRPRLTSRTIRFGRT